MNRILFLFICLLGFSSLASAQGNLLAESRLVHNHSTGFLDARTLNFRVAHSFGDIGGSQGGVHTFYGLDQASDISIGFDYAWTDKWLMGIHRTKGNGFRSGNLQMFTKNAWIKTSKITLATVFETGITTMKSAADVESLSHFQNFSSRIQHLSQLLFSFRPNNTFAFILAPFFHHRNRVHWQEDNSVFGSTVGAQVKLSAWWTLNMEAIIMPEQILAIGKSQPVFSLGFEMNTGGHQFLLHVSNAGDIGTINAVRNNVNTYDQGQFRIGFTISRNFRI